MSPGANKDWVIKLKVKDTAAFAATRSFTLITNDTDAIRPRILPDDTAADETMSADVSKATSTAPGVGFPT